MRPTSSQLLRDISKMEEDMLKKRGGERRQNEKDEVSAGIVHMLKAAAGFYSAAELDTQAGHAGERGGLSHCHCQACPHFDRNVSEQSSCDESDEWRDVSPIFVCTSERGGGGPVCTCTACTSTWWEARRERGGGGKRGGREGAASSCDEGKSSCTAGHLPLPVCLPPPSV
mmetsp:Transcript_11884/g.32153  ORF Transcript_11884/g.32153 Transcript_11884/m.32153 type:complete len:171 (-) Transcript_11884:1632-2144(-)